MNPNKSTEEER
jgi:hypothetical protein